MNIAGHRFGQTRMRLLFLVFFGGGIVIVMLAVVTVVVVVLMHKNQHYSLNRHRLKFKFQPI